MIKCDKTYVYVHYVQKWKEEISVFKGENYLLHYLPGDSPLVHGFSQERNREVFHAGGSNTENNRPCD